MQKRVNRYAKESPKTLDTRQFGESYQRTQGMLYQKMMQESASDVENKEKIHLISPSSPIEFADVGHTTNNNETM